ncbi:MAG: alpha/beta hydrolase [Prolixibacteraceae bacterium]|nr:alpha/beta hydrolase [Prolixibacteraceae bacterium]
MKKLTFLLLLFQAYGMTFLVGQNLESGQISHLQETYKTVGNQSLKVDVFYSASSLEKANNTAIVFFHGGGWAYGKPDEFFTTCERYARMGIIAFSVEYRLSIKDGVVPHPEISPIESVMDAKSAIRWVRQNSGKYQINPEKIVAAGQSAGGQLALATATIPGYDEKTDRLDVSCSPNAVLLFSSCVNTVESWCDWLLGERRNQIWSISPTHNIRAGMPPMIEFHGVDDEQVPKWSLQFYESQMKKAGNYFELHMYPGRKHYLGEGNSKYSRYYDEEILLLTDKFLRKFNFLN